MQLSVNGNQAFAATGGREFDRSQPTVVLLHGAGFDHTAWALHSRWFAHHGYGVLAPDMPGHGRSCGAPLRSIAEMADWTAALLEAAGVARATLVGHSMGSLVALETAARHPAKVSALGLIGTTATMNVGPDLLKAAEKGRTTIITRHGRPVAAVVPVESLAAVSRQQPLLSLKGTRRGLRRKKSRRAIGKLRDKRHR